MGPRAKMVIGVLVSAVVVFMIGQGSYEPPPTASQFQPGSRMDRLQEDMEGAFATARGVEWAFWYTIVALAIGFAVTRKNKHEDRRNARLEKMKATMERETGAALPPTDVSSNSGDSPDSPRDSTSASGDGS